MTDTALSRLFTNAELHQDLDLHHDFFFMNFTHPCHDATDSVNHSILKCSDATPLHYSLPLLWKLTTHLATCLCVGTTGPSRGNHSTLIPCSRFLKVLSKPWL